MGKDTRTPEQARADREAEVDGLHEQLAVAVGQLVTSDDWRRALEFATKFRTYSFGNTLLIEQAHSLAYAQGRVQTPYPTHVANYTQWKSLGRKVPPGGYRILAPIKRRYASTTPQDASSWRKLDRWEKPRPDETVQLRVVSTRPTSVWDVALTTGDPLPELPRPQLLRGQAPVGLWDGLAEQIHAAGFTLHDAPDARSLGGANGTTNLRDRTVHVRADMDDAARARTLAHDPLIAPTGIRPGISPAMR